MSTSSKPSKPAASRARTAPPNGRRGTAVSPDLARPRAKRGPKLSPDLARRVDQQWFARTLVAEPGLPTDLGDAS